MLSIEKLRWFKPEILSKYPHIFGTDKLLMDKYILSFQSSLERITFDIPVGNGIPSLFPEQEKLSKNWLYSSSHKIDALAEFPLSFHLVEVKANGLIGSIGQLISYLSLLKGTYFLSKPVFMHLVTAYIHPDLLSVAKEHNITINHFPVTELMNIMD